MGNNIDKNSLISGLVEAAAKPIIEAKNYWHESIFNVLRGKRQTVETDEEYIVLLKAEIIYIKKLWNKELDVIDEWAGKGEIPEPEKINQIILEIEKDSETEVKDNKIMFKNGKNLDKNDLNFIERYNSIGDLSERIKAIHEDYIYLRIRDYITLNIYQFISQNEEIAETIFKDSPKESTQRIADLTSNYADICMYPDLDDN